ncbi:hypothetical protein K402DRAFT_464727 [Aulographum hederae CBS 113979]|uniref:Uncharacterized protein n=1 Tax=Aulographum hederae CBS 113979 TaxID=1176131 RepID=A0A6G1GVY2_9PEZI|nr:hypothetical protein K402DRAFT_464727 [Aulographum hederae CBS 113979]
MLPHVQPHRPKHPPNAHPQPPSYQQIRSLHETTSNPTSLYTSAPERIHPRNQIEAMPPSPPRAPTLPLLPSGHQAPYLVQAPAQMQMPLQPPKLPNFPPQFDSAMCHPVFFTNRFRVSPGAAANAMSSPVAQGYVFGERKGQKL